MDTLTIKLLHERRSNSRRRKVEGKSGMTYPFVWSDEHKAYIFTTANQEEADDLFHGQGRVMGSYFAPVLCMKKQEVTLSDEVMLGLLERELTMPQNFDAESVAMALLAAHDRGRVNGAKAVAKEVEHIAPARHEFKVSDIKREVAQAPEASAAPQAEEAAPAPQPQPQKQKRQKKDQPQPGAVAVAEA